MRKLLHAIYGMFKHYQLFDVEKVHALSAAAPTPATCLAEVAWFQVQFALYNRERIYLLIWNGNGTFPNNSAWLVIGWQTV